METIYGLRSGIYVILDNGDKIQCVNSKWCYVKTNQIGWFLIEARYGSENMNCTPTHQNNHPLYYVILNYVAGCAIE
jgi:hypothetical protein